jgi:hypothetical protein
MASSMFSIHGQEVRAAAVGRGPVPRAGLAEDGEVARKGRVAGHADLLAAGHPHPVHTADGRLLAAENGVHHGVEEVHVKAVFVRAAGVVLGVLLGVAAGAERAVPHGGEDRRDDRGVGRSALKAGDDALDHFGGVGVVLGGVVEGDPGGED